MKQKFFSPNLDFFGFSASMLCAVHCMALPLVMMFGALSGLAWLENPWIEAIFIGLSFVIATWSLTRSYLLHHHHFTAIRMVAIGFVFLLISRFVEHNWEPILAAVGGITIAGAHWKNWKLQKKCGHCA
jgi:hypothetical protein